MSRQTITPALSLKIPSLHDSKLLETRIYIPYRVELLHIRTANSIVVDKTCLDTQGREDVDWFGEKKVVVVAHPYATLGGNFNDHVVMEMVKVLVRKGWVVGTFNFRGAGNSEGRTSWTGKPEIGDYLGVLGGLLSFVDALSLPSEEAQPASTPRKTKLLMAGYSYGSLITTHLPPVEDMVRQIDVQLEKSSEYKTCIAGLRGYGRDWVCDSSATLSKDKNNVRKHEAPASLHISGIDIQPNYLLISPLLPPLSSFLTLSMFSSAPANSVMSEELGKHKRGNILVVHGDTDVFTSVAKYRQWRETWTVAEEEMTRQTRTVAEIAGAGHLWIEEGAMEQLVLTVGKWADELSS